MQHRLRSASAAWQPQLTAGRPSDRTSPHSWPRAQPELRERRNHRVTSRRPSRKLQACESKLPLPGRLNGTGNFGAAVTPRTKKRPHDEAAVTEGKGAAL